MKFWPSRTIQLKWVFLILFSLGASYLIAAGVHFQFSTPPEQIFMKVEPSKPTSLVKARPEQIKAWREDLDIKKNPEEVAMRRAQLESRLKPILKDDTDYNTIWASCKNKSCYTLYMGQLLLLKPYAKDPKTFNSQICQVYSDIESYPNLGYIPEYTPDLHRNMCKLTNNEELQSTQHLFDLFFWLAFIAGFITVFGLGSLLLLYINPKRNKELPLLIFNEPIVDR